LIAAGYTVWGGLKAVAWADLFQGLALLAGGVTIFFLGLHACGGWEQFSTTNTDKLHMVLPAGHEGLPWTGVFGGMWIVLVYYCGLNQFIVQRNLAARTLRDGQLGVIFAGALWILVPFAIVMPGIMSYQLYGSEMAKADEAFPMLIRNLVPAGLRGFMFAAIAGAVISSLASMLNSASTIFTMDIYNRMFDRNAQQKRLLFLGRVMTMAFVVAGCLLAPMLEVWRSVSIYSAVSGLYLARCGGGIFVWYVGEKGARSGGSDGADQRADDLWTVPGICAREATFSDTGCDNVLACAYNYGIDYTLQAIG
jgi:SSS family solute:Na+ symporter